MSDAWAQEGQSTAAADDGVTAGALLRQAREAAGLHVAALAVALKVPVRKLEALEDNRWDVLPDLVFARGLASSVCRTLKIDAKPILDRLPRTAAPRLVKTSDGINTPFRGPSDGAPPSWLDQMTKPVFLVVFAILLGALILILLPNRQEAPAPVALAPAVAPAEPPPPMVIPAPEPAPTPGATATVTSTPVAMALPNASAPVAIVAATSSAMSAASTPATPASGVVVFRTTGPSWVEVTDGKGVVTLRKQMDSGESAGASGVLPLRVTIGRVDNTDVQVRGKAFDLRPVSRDNVARFEVK
ncbi:MAG: helix-turn-helix domain-containing protein [Pseudomonadota bacterium]